MSKERLEEIKKQLEESNSYDDNPNGYWYRNINWLIEQAELREEQVQRNLQALENINILEDIYDRIESENRRYREALKFYADNMTYNSRFDKEMGAWEITDISKDLGEKAREALGSESDE